MAGANIMLKKGQTLFKEGDASDGMYLIRTGEILVYLEKGGQELKLATLGSGAMIGEMALFDKKPRSASARANQDAEITKIGNDDFAKLMKQIPKWFVGLMTTLSSRLRETNERLQALEAKMKGGDNPLVAVLKGISVLNLIAHKDATKEGKDWVVEREHCENEAAKILAVAPAQIGKIIQALADGRVFTIGKNNYKKDILQIANRGNLEKVIEFIHTFLKEHPTKPGVPASLVHMLECVNKLAQDSAYDTVAIGIKDAMEEGERRKLSTSDWNAHLAFFPSPTKIMAVQKGSDGQAQFKILDKKAFPRLVESYACLAALRAGT